MFKVISLYLFMTAIIWGQNIELTMKNDRFYHKGELYTGIVKEEKFFIRRFTDVITTYENGILTAKKKLIYEEKMIGYTGKYVKDNIAGEYTWDFDNKRIKYRGYVKGALITEGYYNYEFKKIGIWRKYLDGVLLLEEFNYDLLNENNRKSNEVLREISEKEMKKIKTIYPYKENIQWFNSEGKIFEIGDSFDLTNFTGTMKRKINGVLVDLFRYKKGVCYEIRTFFYNGGPKHEMALKKKKFGIGCNGYQRDYYYNGNIEENITVSVGRGYTGPLAAFKSSFNPTGLGRRSVGFHESVSYSGPFRQYYSNGQLMVEGDDYNRSQNVENLTIYDISGNRIFFNN